jgi:hypothetical protein
MKAALPLSLHQSAYTSNPRPEIRIPQSKDSLFSPFLLSFSFNFLLLFRAAALFS